MTDKLPHRLTPDIPGTGPHANSDPVVSAREMEAHTAEALYLMRGKTEAEDARAAIHATLALAWATRLGASRG